MDGADGQVWYLEEPAEPQQGEEPSHQPPSEDGKDILVFYVQASSLRRNATSISLEACVRHFCNARIQGGGPGKRSITKLETGQLYDILGLLRALQLDLKEYNSAAVDKRYETMSSNEKRYACFRLIQQAISFGVKLNPPWQPQPHQSSTTFPLEVPGLDELVTFLEKTFAPRLEHAQDNLDQGVVDFDSLLELFRPGEELLDHGLLSGLQTTTTPLMVRCRASHYVRGKSAVGKQISNFYAACEFVVCTGNERFAVVESRLFLYEFKGTRRIEDAGHAMTMVTGEILTKATNPMVLKELQERGRLYESICSVEHNGTDMTNAKSSGKLVHYASGVFWPVKATLAGQGAASASSGRGGGRSSRTGGRMMVDTQEAWTRGIHAAKAPADGVAGDAVAEAFKAVARISRRREKEASASSEGSSPTKRAEDDEDDMSEDILLLSSPLPESLARRTWPVVCGFSFETRSWGLALVDGLKPVVFHEQAFDDLVLPPQRKRLLRALITSHGQDRGVDVLPGKGEGIIFLLHGPPGVGKTLSAEAVSEVLHRPLYRVSMGELGTSPESLESRLQEIFDLCLPWKSLVLIDEAEMLLEKRTHGGADLVRTAMVCVMLRLMEYYPGILFLTTNSGRESLDPAIASRLTCTLGYDALNADGRREVWKTTLKRVETGEGTNLLAGISDNDLDRLAESYKDINGRQIKNSVQLAWALCRYEKKTLDFGTLKETLEMTNVFPESM